MKKLFCLLLLGSALLTPQSVKACTIPVFRYALEKWDLTPYEIMVYHRGPLPEDVRKELKKWEDAPTKANLEITLIDLDGPMKPRQQKLWQPDGAEKQTPWMLVRYAAADLSEPSAFRGPCTVANLHSVLDSPMRRAILAQLTPGASTVFVLMTSDDPVADRAALDMATRELQMLERRIKVPVQSDEGPKIKLPLPLKVSFPILVLDRKQPAEAAFANMLLATEERLLETKGPILFPIFGRGRVLGGLTGKEISPDQLMEVAKFLCRECSCQVKELNPGIDLLLAADWNAMFDVMYEGKEPVPMPPLAPVYLSPESAMTMPAPKAKASGVVLVANTPEAVRAPSMAPMTAESSSTVSIVGSLPITPTIEPTGPSGVPLRFVLWIGIGAASGLMLLSGGWVVVQMRK